MPYKFQIEPLLKLAALRTVNYFLFMTAESVREHLHATPFVPFSVHLADGRSFLVDHPDFATLMRDDRHLFVNYEGGQGSRHAIIDLNLVTRIEAASREEA